MGSIWGRLALLGGVLSCSLAFADEGMWPIHQVPRADWQKRHNFAPTDDWLLHQQRAAVRLSDGGSGSLVSDDGILLTNHHVARGQLHKLSTATNDLLREGFYARSQAEELRCPDLEVRILWTYEDVTARVVGAIDTKAPADKQNTQRKQIIAAIEKESQEKTGLRSDVVALHSGGQYMLYDKPRRDADGNIPQTPARQVGKQPARFFFARGTPAHEPAIGAIAATRSGSSRARWWFMAAALEHPVRTTRWESNGTIAIPHPSDV